MVLTSPTKSFTDTLGLDPGPSLIVRIGREASAHALIFGVYRETKEHPGPCDQATRVYRFQPISSPLEERGLNQLKGSGRRRPTAAPPQDNTGRPVYAAQGS